MTVKHNTILNTFVFQIQHYSSINDYKMKTIKSQDIRMCLHFHFKDNWIQLASVCDIKKNTLNKNLNLFDKW